MSSQRIKRMKAKGAKYAEVISAIGGDVMDDPSEDDVAGELIRSHHNWITLLDELIASGRMSYDVGAVVAEMHVAVVTFNFNHGYAAGRDGMDIAKINAAQVEQWDAQLTRDIEGPEVH